MPKTPKKISFSSESFHHYLPIPDEILHSGIYVTSVGRDTVHPNESYPRRMHPSLYYFNWNEGRLLPEFSILLVANGSGIFECHQTGRVVLKRGAVILVFPGVWHRYRPEPKSGWTEKWVQFNGELPHKLLDHRIIFPEQPVLYPRNSDLVEITLDRLQEIVHQNPISNSLSLSLQTLSILSLALSDSFSSVTQPEFKSTINTNQSDPIVAAAIDFIWTRSHKPLSVMDVVEAVGVTRRTLERHMASALGHSVLEEIVNCRFNRAERLLRETQLPIKTIVTLAGFGSLENMRQVFIARTNLSPALYRNQRQLSPFQ